MNKRMVPSFASTAVVVLLVALCATASAFGTHTATSGIGLQGITVVGLQPTTRRPTNKPTKHPTHFACPAHTTGPAGDTDIGNCACDVDYFGKDGACQKCPNRSHSAAASRAIGECKCDSGYFNDIVDHNQGAISDIHCVPLPPLFHYNTKGKCAIEDPRDNMKYGTLEIIAPDSKLDPAKVGKMFEHLAGIDTGLIPRGDYNGLCQTLMVHLFRNEPICNANFPLFDRYAAAMDNNNFLGYVTPKCVAPGYGEAAATKAVLDMCVTPCMESKSTKCCRVPSLVQQYFTCCSAFKCCPEQQTSTPPPSTHGPCVDKHTRCPGLKELLDKAGFDCYTTDVGKATGAAIYNGKHLIDECCKSCTPAPTCDPKCEGCMLFASTAKCSTELNLDCTPCDTIHRRAQGGVGNAVAQQVNGHARSKYQLRKLLSCLKSSGKTSNITAHAHRRYRHRRQLGHRNCSAGSTCSICLVEATSSTCPTHMRSQHAPSCADVAVKVGDWCEGDGECGTKPHLNNCPGGYDVYQRVNASIAVNSFRPTKQPDTVFYASLHEDLDRCMKA